MSFKEDKIDGAERGGYAARQIPELKKIYLKKNFVNENLDSYGNILILQPTKTVRRVGYPKRIATVFKYWFNAEDVTSSFDLYLIEGARINGYGRVKNLISHKDAFADMWHVNSANVNGLFSADTAIVANEKLNVSWLSSGKKGIDCGGEIRTKNIESKGMIFAKRIVITSPTGGISAYDQETKEQFPIIAEEIIPNTNYIRKGKGYFVSAKDISR
jgi:hypothetical protein